MLDALEAKAIGRKLARALATCGVGLGLGALLGLAGALACSSAEAQSRPRTFGRNDPLMPVRIDARVSLDWYGALGTGARVDIPLVAAPRLQYNPRDEVSLSLGGDVTFVSLDGTSEIKVYPSFAFQWSLGVSDRFYFYPEVGVTAVIHRSGWDGLSPNLGFGARYYLHRSFGIFGRLGWPMALSGGAIF